jgi:chorismate mutase
VSASAAGAGTGTEGGGGRTVRSRRAGGAAGAGAGTTGAVGGVATAVGVAAGASRGDSVSGRGEGPPDGRAATGAADAAGGLAPFRARLDEIDDAVARLLGERFEVCRAIALYKREHEIPMMQPDRVVAVRKRYLARGAEVDLPADFTAALFELMIGATCKMEDELIDGASPDGATPSPSAAI